MSLAEMVKGLYKPIQKALRPVALGVLLAYCGSEREIESYSDAGSYMGEIDPKPNKQNGEKRNEKPDGPYFYVEVCCSNSVLDSFIIEHNPEGQSLARVHCNTTNNTSASLGATQNSRPGEPCNDFLKCQTVTIGLVETYRYGGPGRYSIESFNFLDMPNNFSISWPAARDNDKPVEKALLFENRGVDLFFEFDFQFYKDRTYHARGHGICPP